MTWQTTAVYLDDEKLDQMKGRDFLKLLQSGFKDSGLIIQCIMLNGKPTWEVVLNERIEG